MSNSRVFFFKLAAWIWAQGAEMSFFAIFLSLDHKYSLKLNTMIASNNV